MQVKVVGLKNVYHFELPVDDVRNSREPDEMLSKSKSSQLLSDARVS